MRFSPSLPPILPPTLPPYLPCYPLPNAGYLTLEQVQGPALVPLPASCDPFLPDANRNLPVHLAASGGHADVLDMLLSECARPRWGLELALPACELRALEQLQCLHNLQLQLQACNRDRRQPLHVACAGARLEAIRVLLRHRTEAWERYGKLQAAGAGWMLERVGGWLLAAQGQAAKALGSQGGAGAGAYSPQLQQRHLLPIADVAADVVLARDRHGLAPMHLAVAAGHGALVALLRRQAGASVRCENNDREQPLHMAAERGHAQLLAQLLRPEVWEGRGQGAAGKEEEASEGAGGGGEVAAGGKREGRERKTDAADARATDKRGQLALHRAAQAGAAEALQLLLELPGADVNAPDADGWTPLHLACDRGHVEVVRALLAVRGAVSGGQPGTPGRALGLAGHVKHAQGRVEHAGGVQGHGQQQGVDLEAVTSRRPAGTGLVTFGSGVSAPCRMTAVQLAVKAGHAAVVQLLIKRRARLDVTDPATGECRRRWGGNLEQGAGGVLTQPSGRGAGCRGRQVTVGQWGGNLWQCAGCAPLGVK